MDRYRGLVILALLWAGVLALAAAAWWFAAERLLSEENLERARAPAAAGYVATIFAVAYPLFLRDTLKSKMVGPRTYREMVLYATLYAQNFVTQYTPVTGAAGERARASAYAVRDSLVSFVHELHNHYHPRALGFVLQVQTADPGPGGAGGETVFNRANACLNTAARAVDRLQVLGALTPTEAAELTRLRTTMSQGLIKIDVLQRAPTPRIMTAVIPGVIAVFFLLMPVSLLEDYGRLTIIVYPLVALLILSPVIVSQFVGDPFSGKTYWAQATGINGWRDEEIATILGLFDTLNST